MLNRRPLRGLFSCRRFQPLLRHFVAALKVNGKKNPAALATLKEIIKKVRSMQVTSVCHNILIGIISVL